MPAAIMDEAWLAVSQICRHTPGLRAVLVTTHDTSWRVARACGELARIPMGSSSALPTVPAEPVMVERPLYDAYTFDVAAGQRCSWLAIFLPGTRPAAWLILGSPTPIRDGVLVPLRTVVGLVCLALRPTGGRHDAPVPQLDRQSWTPPEPDSGNQSPLAGLDVHQVADAVRRAGDEVQQQVSELLQHQPPPGAAAQMTEQGLARLASGMVDDISQEVSQRLIAALVSTRPSPGTPTPQNAARTESDLTASSATPGEHSANMRGRDPAELDPTASPDWESVDGSSARPAREEPLPAPGFAAEELKAAVAADEIVVRYQPIMSASGDRCTGVEALARWQHPRHGLLNPAQFLPATDDSEGIRAVGTHVLRQAVAQGAQWHRQFPEHAVPVHVNVSAEQLDEGGFVTTVRDCLDESSLPAHSLVLEVIGSPTALSSSAREQLHSVAADGVQVAVSVDRVDATDENMSHWRDLPISIVKVDGRTRTDKDLGPSSRPESIVEMARRLGLRTVAEGVQDRDQQVRLREAGADSTQGYLHSEPVSAGAVGAWLSVGPPAQP